MSSERRIHPRKVAASPVVLFCGGETVRAQLNDVSSGGARITSELSLALGQPCELLVQVSFNRFKRVAATVVRRHSSSLGVEFERSQPSLVA